MIRLCLIVLLLVLCCPASFAAAGAGPAYPQDDDERRLWLRADEEVKKLNDSSQIYKNAEMELYLDNVVKTLRTREELAVLPLKFRIIRERSCNAFIFPNGSGYINTGMLANMENEAQLATILAHESIHAINRHMLKEFRDTKDKSALSTVLGMLTGNLLTPLGHLGALASMKGYSRELEAEADREGFRLLMRAGYDPYEAPKVFGALQKEAKVEDRKETFFFASHPMLQARIDNFNALLAVEANGKKGKNNAEGYLRTFAVLLLENAEMDMKAGHFGRAQDCITRYIVARGEDARACLLMGETFRRNSSHPDLVKAKELYQKAVRLDPLYPEPYRMLGLIAYKEKDVELARKSLGEYLKLQPGAQDRGYIEGMLQNLR
ncbi:hypothetical protein E4633_07355 [Geomonas terrae]|uniref:Peptidase M48 domain-containing protein n=1 Tax=Geomonas terrae TaxID=2562681 RepID=A0A4S1CF34_9BACT|nr:M48 family metalloprotease [Geomonas terrae]TGU72128.1 hypothetical protein E4633_07355 [Geomonas terrae]